MILEEYYKQMLEDTTKEPTKTCYNSIKNFEDLSTDEQEEFKYQYVYLSTYNNLCEKYNLHQIAGQGNTLKKALYVMNWLSENTYYSGMSPYGVDTAENILQYSWGKGFDRAINCANKAIILSDFLMSLKIFAIPVWITNEIMDSSNEYFAHGLAHVVVHIYLPEVKKWVMIDPSFNAYIVDELGNILNVVEILEQHKQGATLSLGQYSFNTNETMFREYYIDNFIIACLGRISIWKGNALDKRKYFLEAYNLIPKNMDYKQFLEKVLQLDIVGDQYREMVRKNIDHLNYISVLQFLDKPHWDVNNII